MMTTLFHTLTILVTPFWVAMIFAPRWKVTQRVMHHPWVIVPAIVCYAVPALQHMPELLAALVPASPESIAGVLSKPWGGTMVWAYFGAFDLFVGRWIFRDAHERGISPWVTGPILALTAIFGPFGFVSYGAAVAIFDR